jgi:drug/metabolite transporter (DMT)-like permease
MSGKLLAPPRLHGLSDRGRGALLVGLATLVWSTSGVISRLSVATSPTLLFWRSMFALPFLLSVLAFRPGGVRKLLHLGWTGWGVAVCFAISMLTFMFALRLTTVAHVLIFQAAAPFFAAMLAWVWLRERIDRTMLLAIGVTMAGIGVMVSGSWAQGQWLGDVLSLAMCVSFAAMIVLARVDQTVDMLSASCAATLLAGLASAPFTQWPASPGEIGLMMVFGVVQMGVALLMFTAGVRLLPAADSGLISVLEAVFSPIWAWLAVGENPGNRALLGGAIVVVAVVCYGWHERRGGGAS